ncbi:glycoside hydrolase [Leptotrichia sp. OH3620_COT-345]|uniref:C40 family peptidase n=1 Tax=Leptotrichia sp. OH3620_COT-345 TaxID=2491048 RepID=UPI000F655104|nr:NlpC/P60 family protein [Leptotrichia sp. OH3620_COT-345]RRD39054.1 glycoside hydrolase [Leptotrichia sp. OH3620_COT-345]
MKKKKIILGIMCFFLALSCSSINNKGKSGKGRNIGKITSDEQIVGSRLKELKREQDRIFSSGTADEIDRVILENQLLKSFNNWKGTKYVWGGDSSRGMDCSALTRRVYREVFGYELPRVSTDQVKVGKKVSVNNLKPGDILFFKPENRVNHTAVYLGNSLFINASTSKGVVLSSLESSYWGKYFKYAVRVDPIRKS